MTEELDEYAQSQAFRTRHLQFPRKDVVAKAIELLESGDYRMCCLALSSAVLEMAKSPHIELYKVIFSYANLFQDHCWIVDGLVQRPHWWNSNSSDPETKQARIAALKSFLETCHD